MPVILVVITLALLGGGYLGLSALANRYLEQPIVHTVNDPGDANTTWKSDKPLSYAEAITLGRCPVSLPPEATDIQFVDFYAGYGGFVQCVRFAAPIDMP